MKNRNRFIDTLNFKKTDRLPVVEWASWWDKTIDRWKTEGLPDNLSDQGDIRDFFGLDALRQQWIEPRKSSIPDNHINYKPLVTSFDDYTNIKEHLFPENPFNPEEIKDWAKQQEAGNLVIWITLEGFFWFPRTLFGMEEHIYAFYDYPELMHQMNKDVLEYNIKMLDEFCRICKPDFMTFAEDMSYNKGPMISKSLFDEFLAPYYKVIIPKVKEYGIIPFVDTDGNPQELIPWFMELGIEGFLPMEKQAGTDLEEIRKQNPKVKMIGGYNKTVMHKGEEEIRKEFDRILPIMKQGGYIPGVDHQTPPAVSMEEYYLYLKILREYCQKAVE
jgi:hypothetical protein